jgi:hypothetical protein
MVTRQTWQSLQEEEEEGSEKDSSLDDVNISESLTRPNRRRERTSRQELVPVPEAVLVQQKKRVQKKQAILKK